MMTRANEQRILSEDDCNEIFSRVEKRIGTEGTYTVRLASYWQAGMRWARNRVSLASDRHNIALYVDRGLEGGHGTAVTNQLDDESLDGVVQAAKRKALEEKTFEKPLDMRIDWPHATSPNVHIWSDTTFNRTPEQNGQLIKKLTERSDAAGVLAAGYLETIGGSTAGVETDSQGRRNTDYAKFTQAQCSVTARHPSGDGSGWAGQSGYDFADIPAEAISQRALDKCLASLHPVRIEPGRYTVILEPQAVADLVNFMINGTSRPVDRTNAESGRGPFVENFDKDLGLWRSKLGLQVVDTRVTISHDPTDPELGVVPPQGGIGPVTWIKDGVLQTLGYHRAYAVNRLGENTSVAHRNSFRMSGGTSSVDEMIASTKRGLLVTRFSDPKLLDGRSLLSTGFTRDGMWLIENGKITHAVKNFRFTESPLFILNNVQALGKPVPVFNPGLNVEPKWAQELMLFQREDILQTIVVPPIKAKDFSFTSTIDAI